MPDFANPDPLMIEALAFTDGLTDFFINVAEAHSPDSMKMVEEFLRPLMKKAAEAGVTKLVTFLEGHVGFLKAIVARKEAADAALLPGA